MRIISGIPVWGEPIDPGTLDQAITCRRTAEHVALMADHHLGYSVPIGGVVAYRDAVSPSGVGYDIGCGNKAVRLDALGADVERDINRVMDEIVARISFGMGRVNPTPVDHPVLAREDDRWKHPLRGGDLDEAPQAYKRLPDVIAHHRETLELEHVLRPIGVAMAGREVFDPYKD